MRKQHLLILFLFFFSISMSAQHDYNEKWSVIENLEIEGKTQSAEQKISEIYDLAKQENNQSQFIKAFLYKAKYILLLKEDAALQVYQSLRKEIKNAEFPSKNILESILAESLENYLDKNAYRIRNRTVTDTIRSKDFRTWDLKTLYEITHGYYQRSLSGHEQLATIPNEKFAEILSSGNEYNLRPTLYDMLANRALSFYKSPHSYTSKFIESQISYSDFYTVPEVFKDQELEKNDTLSSHRISLRIYQKLEEIHRTRQDSFSLVHTAIERFEFLESKRVYGKKSNDYFAVLQKLNSQYNTGLANKWLLLKAAQFYKQHMNIKNHPDYNKRALLLCNQILNDSDASVFKSQAEKLRNVILNPDLTFTTERFIIPNKESRALISFKNIDSVYVSFYKVPFQYQSIQDSYYQIDSLITEFAKNRIPHKKISYKLPKNEFYEVQSTEVIIPKLEQGRYLILAKQKSKASFESNLYGINFIQITPLAVVNFSDDYQNKYQILHRETGIPIQNATITLADKFNSYKKITTTDATGSVVIKTNKKSHQLETLITKNNDSLWLNTYLQQRYNEDDTGEVEKKDEYILKASLLTDRSIYRPGQTIYFKGILTQLKKQKQSPVHGQYVSVILYDANDNEIEELRLKTNKFGSVHGEFKLPGTGVTGQYYLEMDEDYDEESDFWDDAEDFEYAEHYIQVEEYKRPKFEITFDKISETYVLNDSVYIKGKAKAFLGSSISNASVKYNISRTVPYHLQSEYDNLNINGETQTDGKGSFTIPFIAMANPEPRSFDKSVFNYNISVEITDINGETRDASKTIKIGYHALTASLEVNPELDATDSKNKVYVKISNLNGEVVEGSGIVSIYKCKSVQRVFRKRPWDYPDIQEIPEDVFISLFPNDPYTKNDIQNSKEIHLVTTYTIDTGKEDAILLGDISDWIKGGYIVKFETKDRNRYNITSRKKFNLYDPSQHYLTQKQLFAHKIVDDKVSSKGILDVKLQTSAELLYVTVKAYQKDKTIFDAVIAISKGEENISIPLLNKTNKVDFLLSFVKYNSCYSERFTYTPPIEAKKLSIEIETFRNKIEPGSQETWSLKITDQDEKKASAEVLASMYDASLDQFKPHEWQDNISFSTNSGFYNNIPNVDTSLSFQNNQVWIKNIKSLYYETYNFNIARLNKFGYSFTYSDQAHKKYVRTINYRANLSTPNDAKKEIGKDLKVSGGNVTGIVLDIKGNPLPGVNVVIKGTNKGTVADFDGIFTIEANKDDILEFSYLGFISAQTSLNDKEATIIMKEDVSNLDEVVVIGYGTVKRKSLTSSIAVVTSESFEKTISDKLGGNVAGISIVSSSGRAGATSQIRIRGISSAIIKNQPLFVVDGVPITKGLLSINSIDIANLEVLKGSAASAIYGSKASNGVIIITTKKGLDDLQKIQPRKKFKETAFFFPQLRTDRKGNVKFSFTSPDALTRWKFQALAHNKKLHTKIIQSEVVTQKELSIIPNTPRFLREKDTITISTKIANLSSKTINGIISLQLTDELTQEKLQVLTLPDKPVQNFKIDPNGNTSINWKLYVPDNLKAIRYRIIAKAGKFSDGEENILPVLSNRILVTESIPIWIRSGKQKTFGFKKLQNGASSTQKNHQITLEYTTNPAWFAIKSLPYLMEFPYACAEQTFARFYSNVIASHILNSNPKIKEVFDTWKANGQLISNLEKNEDLKNILIQESPWLRDAKNEKEQQIRLATLFDASKLSSMQKDIIRKLDHMQKTSGGFPWFANGHENEFITRHILAGFGHLQKLNIKTEVDDDIKLIVKYAIKYLDKKYLEDYRRRKTINIDYTFSSKDLHYFYTRSFWEKTHPLPSEINTIYEKFIAIENNKWLEKDLYNKALLALIVHRKKNSVFAKKIIKTLSENAVHSDKKGMYWKENKAGWNWYNSPIETHALIIEAYAEITGNKKIINELKIWLLKNKQTHSWATTKSTTEAIYALLLEGDRWLSIDKSLDISFGTVVSKNNKIQPNGLEAGTGYFKKQWSAEDITKKMGSITIKNKSKVPQYGGYYWQYFENLDNISTPEEYQIFIKKELFSKLKKMKGESLQKVKDIDRLKIGDIITVRIELDIKNDFEFVHMKDMRASGLEPINVISQYKWQDGLGYYESTKDASTNFFFDYLPKGVYVFEYDLRVNNKGDFSNGITTIQSMYAPEFSSHSEGVRVKVGE